MLYTLILYYPIGLQTQQPAQSASARTSPIPQNWSRDSYSSLAEHAIGNVPCLCGVVQVVSLVHSLITHFAKVGLSCKRSFRRLFVHSCSQKHR